MDWIIHLDTDELLHPAGAQEYSLQRLLRDVAADVDMVVFPNYVSSSFYQLRFAFFYSGPGQVTRSLIIADVFCRKVQLSGRTSRILLVR
jgi:hypothetical protein